MTDAIAALSAVKDERAASATRCSRASRRGGATSRSCSTSGSRCRRSSLRADTLPRVRALLAHPRFNARNPEPRPVARRRRSRCGTGARSTRHDGTGYAFVGEQVLALDRRNPQLAATLAGAFNLWRRFAEPRRALQRTALETIGRAPELSPDVAEIVERNLAD